MDINITNPVTASKIGEVVNASASATPNDTDLVMSVDTSVAKKNTWTQVKAFLKTYFDTIYQAAGSYLTSANITQTITNGVTDKAPSEDAIYDALALKADKSNTTLSTYLEVPEQSKPATPTNAIRFYTDTSNRFSWIGENGYVRTFDGTANTADRSYTLPNVSGIIALTSSTTNIVHKLTTSQSVNTGDTNQNINYSFLIPANTYTTGDFFQFTAMIIRTTTTASVTLGFYLNTSNSLSGATLIVNTFQITSTQRSTKISRSLAIKSDTNTEVEAVSTVTKENTSTNTQYNLNISWSSAQYFIITLQNSNSTDSITTSSLMINKF